MSLKDTLRNSDLINNLTMKTIMLFSIDNIPEDKILQALSPNNKIDNKIGENSKKALLEIKSDLTNDTTTYQDFIGSKVKENILLTKLEFLKNDTTDFKRIRDRLIKEKNSRTINFQELVNIKTEQDLSEILNKIEPKSFQSYRRAEDYLKNQEIKELIIKTDFLHKDKYLTPFSNTIREYLLDEAKEETMVYLLEGIAGIFKKQNQDKEENKSDSLADLALDIFKNTAGNYHKALNLAM